MPVAKRGEDEHFDPNAGFAKLPPELANWQPDPDTIPTARTTPRSVGKKHFTRSPVAPVKGNLAPQHSTKLNETTNSSSIGAWPDGEIFSASPQSPVTTSAIQLGAVSAASPVIPKAPIRERTLSVGVGANTTRVPSPQASIPPHLRKQNNQSFTKKSSPPVFVTKPVAPSPKSLVTQQESSAFPQDAYNRRNMAQEMMRKEREIGGTLGLSNERDILTMDDITFENNYRGVTASHKHRWEVRLERMNAIIKMKQGKASYSELMAMSKDEFPRFYDDTFKQYEREIKKEMVDHLSDLYRISSVQKEDG